jgi:hypothetical protein
MVILAWNWIIIPDSGKTMINHPHISTIKRACEINHPVRGGMPSSADGEPGGSHTVLVRLAGDFSLDWLRGKSRGKTDISW